MDEKTLTAVSTSLALFQVQLNALLLLMDSFTIWILDNVVLFSFAVILLYICFAIWLLKYSYRISEKSLVKSQIATYVAQVSVVIVIGFCLTGIFNKARDREQQKVTLRKEHLAQLQPVLRKDGERLLHIAHRMQEEGRLSNINNDPSTNEDEWKEVFFPHLLTEDVRNHYPQYWEEKERLRGRILQQDTEFRKAFDSVKSSLILPPMANSHHHGVARSIMARCLKKGPGFTLTQNASGVGYSCSLAQAACGSTAGQPPADLLSAYEAFKAFRFTPESITQCQVLNEESTAIYDQAKKLSSRALLLAEQTQLPGHCEYLRLE